MSFLCQSVYPLMVISFFLKVKSAFGSIYFATIASFYNSGAKLRKKFETRCAFFHLFKYIKTQHDEAFLFIFLLADMFLVLRQLALADVGQSVVLVVL